jgi:hypothetical protein
MTKSMNPDPFEKRLAAQPLRSVPPAWRAEILSAAGQQQQSAAAQPAPEAWRAVWNWIRWAWRGGFAAVWALILFFKWSAPVLPETRLAGPAPSPREVLTALRRQASEASDFSDLPHGFSPHSHGPINSPPG